MKKVVFAGSFDPITNGHLWIIEQGTLIAEEVLVFIAKNDTKKNMFSALKRKEMIDNTLLELNLSDKVKTFIVSDEYVATKALEMGATHLIRGIRSSSDFDYESILSTTNNEVLNGAQTLFLIAPQKLQNVSSSFVKSFIGPANWSYYVKEFVPYEVLINLQKNYIENFCNNHLKQHPKNKEFLDFIFSQYSQKSRYYHNLTHLCDMLSLLNHYISNVSELNVEEKSSLILAILGHDAVYLSNDKTISDEKQSANKLLEFFNDNLAYELILSTSHLENVQYNFKEKENHYNLFDLMQYLDLSILAQPKEIYENYTKNIRKEYSIYNDNDFFKGRIVALEKLKLNTFFNIKELFHLNVKAKENIENEIVKLSSLK